MEVWFCQILPLLSNHVNRIRCRRDTRKYDSDTHYWHRFYWWVSDVLDVYIHTNLDAWSKPGFDGNVDRHGDKDPETNIRMDILGETGLASVVY